MGTNNSFRHGNYCLFECKFNSAEHYLGWDQTITGNIFSSSLSKFGSPENFIHGSNQGGMARAEV